MKLTKRDKETVVLYNEAQSTASVYTHDPKLKEKLKQLSEKYPKQMIMEKTEQNGGMTYTIPKKCVLIREPYSEERRKAASERAKTAGYRPPQRCKVGEIE